MRREDGEPVQDFHIRVKNIITRKMMTDPMGKYLLDSSIFHQECLDVFYRGLRSRALAKEAMDKGAQTVKEALIHISNFVGIEIRLEDCDDKKEIPFATDKDLYLNPSKGKFVCNSIFKVGELDQDGNVAVNFQEYEDEQTINAVTQIPSHLVCQQCGNHKFHGGYPCPALGKKCNLCGKEDHFREMCKSGLQTPVRRDSNVRRMATPAQQRHTETLQRRRALESRKINNIDVLDHPVGAMGDSSDEEGGGYDIDILINALTQAKKKKKILIEDKCHY